MSGTPLLARTHETTEFVDLGPGSSGEILKYDGAGNKVLTTQAVGTTQQRQTSYTYDLDNRLVQVTDPMGGVTHYQYNAQGNQTQIIDANGGVQVNTFDAMGRELSSLSAGGSASVPANMTWFMGWYMTSPANW